MAKVEEYVRELFEKTTANEKGLAESLEVLELKVLYLLCFVCRHSSVGLRHP